MALYSPKYNLLFIHIYKTAGSSMREYIKSIDNESTEFVSIHSNAKDTLSSFNLNNNPANVFSIVRNPYEWFFSLYNYIMYNKGSHFLYKLIYDKSFEDFVAFYSQNLNKINSLTNKFEQCQSQTEFLYINGKIAVGTVFKNENLKEDFYNFCYKNELPIKDLPNINDLNSVSRMGKMTNKSIDIINYLFEYDFINFGYKMI